MADAIVCCNSHDTQEYHASFKIEGNVLEIVPSPSPHPIPDLSTSDMAKGSPKVRISGQWAFDELAAIINAIGRSLEAAHAEQQQREQKNSETSRLETLFPGLDLHPDIIDIKAMFAKGCIHKRGVPPRFFDGLLYVMEQDSTYCGGVFSIDLELIPEENYDQNIFHVTGVLNELIECSNLQSLVLRKFPPDMLLASLVTLRDNEELDFVDVSHNSLTTAGLDFVLRRLPSDPIDKIEVHFEHNRITTERSVGLLLRDRTNLKSVTISEQAEGKLDIAEIQQLMNTAIALN